MGMTVVLNYPLRDKIRTVRKDRNLKSFIPNPTDRRDGSSRRHEETFWFSSSSH